MQKWVKNALIGGAAFVAYRLYKLWEMFNSLNWSFQNVRFTRPKLKSLADSYIMSIGFKIHNSSSTTLILNGLTGYIEYDGYVLGRFSMGKTKIERGDTKITIDIDLDPKYVATILIPDLVSRKAPVMTLIINAELFLGIKVREKFKFNVKDYLPEGVSQLFFK
jgi:hypothetical protein